MATKPKKQAKKDNLHWELKPVKKDNTQTWSADGCSLILYLETDGSKLFEGFKGKKSLLKSKSAHKTLTAIEEGMKLPSLNGDKLISAIEAELKGLPKEKKEKGERKPAANTDQWGSREGSNFHRVNAAITKNPKTIKQILEDANYDQAGPVRNHMKKLIARNGVKEVREEGQPLKFALVA